MPLIRLSKGTWCLVALVGLACSNAFRPNRYPTNESLYAASLREYRARRWDGAIAGFDKLTLELPARDSLLSRSHYYLAMAHERKGEHLLAAQSFSRLTETFPDDSLADDALLAAGRSYKEMWRKPTLDPTYGQTALSTYRTLLSLYPNSPLVDDATREIARLEEWFARKDYENGMYYMRRKAYDPAIIYFKDVARLYPNTATARNANLRLVDAYKEIRYREEIREVCAGLHQRYPGDREVVDTCGAAPPPPAVAVPTP